MSSKSKAKHPNLERWLCTRCGGFTPFGQGTQRTGESARRLQRRICYEKGHDGALCLIDRAYMEDCREQARLGNLRKNA